MSRCLQLAGLGAGLVAPNPMVGAVLVFNDRIIGEGYHQKYGQPHAEVNCLKSVREQDRPHIEKSTLYVSLEPCSHFGKTPPCADLIIEHRIPKVVIGSKDIFEAVAGRGIQKLQQAGVTVVTGVLEADCLEVNKRFFTFHTKYRPYIILKWAQSMNGKIGVPGRRIPISNPFSNRVAHRWRSEESAIMVGTNTAATDDPLLTTRLWQGKNPVRIVIDKNLRLPADLKIFNPDAATIIFNLKKNHSSEQCTFIKLNGKNFLEDLLHGLFETNLQSVIVEGGRATLQSFIDGGLWDEARIITNQELVIENGVAAPDMKQFQLRRQERFQTDIISYYCRCE